MATCKQSLQVHISVCRNFRRTAAAATVKDSLTVQTDGIQEAPVKVQRTPGNRQKTPAKRQRTPGNEQKTSAKRQRAPALN